MRQSRGYRERRFTILGRGAECAFAAGIGGIGVRSPASLAAFLGRRGLAGGYAACKKHQPASLDRDPSTHGRSAPAPATEECQPLLEGPVRAIQYSSWTIKCV